MHKNLTSAVIAAAIAAAVAVPSASAASNAEITARHFAALVSGPAPKTAELAMFFNNMPKGADLHHHYSGSIYAEQYLEWVDKLGYCVDKTSWSVQTDKAADRKNCATVAQLEQDPVAYRELLHKWSTLDFYNHSENQLAPDLAFFTTFPRFNDVASTNGNDGQKRLKQRAIAENVSYIETVFEIAPITFDAEFDGKLTDEAAFAAYLAKLEASPAFAKGIADYSAYVDSSSAGIDDDNFTMRYQPFVLRFLSPSIVFSQMAAGFKIASQNPKVVSVNIVGAEHYPVSMRDYRLHMRMYKFLSAKYPNVKLSLHAGELALGQVPPEGLKFHIAEAIDVAGAKRIGHGMDIAHESQPQAILKKMREKNVAVEVNLTSNEFILGVKGEAHPVNIYRKYGVPFILSSDDTGVSRNTLSNEYVLFASRYKTSYAEVKRLSYDSIRYAFLAEADKQRLTKQLDTRFAKFEADIAELGAKSRQ
ncbi:MULTISPECIES: adenosine deaminase [unclassified Duganella]|uniref:adenosine deaminase family protein n=1 Tax=unclassified Duganella TaxID=2636909 RepID=UPI0006F9AA17|nr:MULTISPECIES: adenosine deaminase [unclassified Duganella]KQV51182.1 adenosine deaminase [Duganella sp. Root336D2]KRC03030.1 adenosine deaminase [Duganella sp. Root198D2]